MPGGGATRGAANLPFSHSRSVSTVAAMQLAHSRRGSGPAIVVINQLDPRAYWEETVADLSGDHEIIEVTLPGFGESPPLPSSQEPDPPTLARAVADWLGAQGIRAPFVTGSSLGGAVAIELARLDAVSGALAISPVGFWTRGEARAALGPLRIGRAVARAVERRPGALTANPIGRRLAFGQMVAHPDRLSERAARASVTRTARSPGFEATRHALMDYRAEGRPAPVPVTVAWAERDRVTKPDQAKRVRAFLPGADVITLRDCGHAAMVDDPAQVARVIREAAVRVAQPAS